MITERASHRATFQNALISGAVRGCAINAQADLGHRPRHHSASPGWIDPAAPATVDPGAQSSCVPAFYWRESFLQ